MAEEKEFKNAIDRGSEVGFIDEKDDMDVLRFVLQNVRGASPVEPYRTADYADFSIEE